MEKYQSILHKLSTGIIIEQMVGNMFSKPPGTKPLATGEPLC
jgi:hypothetical protein